MTSTQNSLSSSAEDHPVLQGIFNALLVCSVTDFIFGALHYFIPESVHGVRMLVFILSTLGTGLSVTLVILAASMYARTPWRPFIPLIGVYTWGSVSFIPLPAFTGMAYIEPISLELQGLATVFAILRVRNLFGSKFLFPPHAFLGCRFSWLHCLTAHGVMLVAGVGFLIGSVVGGILTVEHLAAGFLRIRSSGVYTETRVYDFKGARLYLLPSVHVASSGFYENLVKQVPSENSVILPEGVTDRNHLLPRGIDHATTAKSVGLTPQPQLTEIKKIAIRPCDGDVSDFSPKTLTVLRFFGELIDAFTKHDSATLVRMLSQSPEMDLDALRKDILDGRNARVIAGIENAVSEYQHIAVPWGAAHMAGIEKELLRKGARTLHSERVRVFSWEEIKLVLP
jgi:hypothetical protein